MILRSFFLLALVNLSISKHHPPSNDTSWDLLVFTQHWPVTVCSQWEEVKINNKCTLPPKENLWTIHGIWPTRKGSEGPLFCNRTWHFDPKQLEPILPDLELYWVNIESNTPLYSFWKHEWMKHGTCAATLPEIDGELAFFRKGLEWVQEYGMAGILTKSRIDPGQTGYTVQKIYDSVKEVLGQNPIIECVVDKHTKESLIQEIRLCFSKNLTLIDCNSVKDKFNLLEEEKILTNCDLNKTVMYFDKVPATGLGRNEKFDQEYFNKLYNVYNFVQHLIWVTL